ncbi:hypothetical protein CIW49_00930 [Mycolicibacterium sp. P1-18]|uniref:hypothetical protein n=1 Tax=Mycolicibacterium sp. P1-18 TaxID=2024615 RepID=UPI0011F2806D|nr:hypothetical protein [Mycolicibacterium sp. P1-18]KAA0101955.1 hypothetical protein CIW49_00930 [Mycolicibacterium sp. P1-18]
MRGTVVAGVGGLIIGHVLWLAAISVATKTTTVDLWVLVAAGVTLLVAVGCVFLGRRYHRRKEFAKAAFLWCLPVSPLLFSVSVLAVTYL